MRYRVVHTKKFKRQYEKLLRSGNNRTVAELQKVINLLTGGESLPESLHNHSLIGIMKNFYECHIQPDWLLIYRIDREILVLELIATGSHGELFG